MECPCGANIGADGGVRLRPYHTIIAEFTVNDTTSKPSLVHVCASLKLENVNTWKLVQFHYGN